MTRILREPAALRDACRSARASGARVGVVPTMGALHDGHLALVDDAAKRGATFQVVTVFVNPLQFGPSEDLDRYPRTLDADVALCEARGVDVVFAPTDGSMYPPGFQTHVVTGALGEVLEGAHRPAHFRGVTTVVCKLLSLVGEAIAVFGRKDYQQWRILERMVHDLDLPTEIVGHPIVREPDGLALSSRNRYLSEAARSRALCLSAGLAAAAEAYAAGEHEPDVLARIATAIVEPAVDAIDYVAVVDALTLQAPEETGRALVALVAAHVEGTRLIDNREL